MKHGDFTNLARQYVNRPGYSPRVLRLLASEIKACREAPILADVGAGTGKLTENLVELGLKGYAIEPNDAMRQEALNSGTTLDSFKWLKGSAEETGLNNRSVDWILMASSFHWTDKRAALNEFSRILTQGGFFTALWNPRDIEKSALHIEIENIVKHYIPELKRVSSGAGQSMSGMTEDLLSTGQFADIVYLEAPHEEVMSKERYMGVWRSVNDIQVQAGQDKFNKIISDIEYRIKGLDRITVPYRTRAWTVQAK